MRLRRLPEVRASGEEAWFRPALDRLRSLRGETDARLSAFFTDELPLYIARAPGRLDVMGGIADYSGAQVWELPLAQSTSALLQRQRAPRCELATRREGRWQFFEMDLAMLLDGELRTPDALRNRIAERETDLWPAYALGVVQYCLQRAARPEAHDLPGFRLLIDSTVPEGRGIASSAALEVAAMAVVATCCGTTMSAEELATACQWVENRVVGAPCGIMDQMTSACGLRGRLLRLRCQPASIEGHMAVPAGYRFYGIDSGLRHAVTGSDYETVRSAAFMGYRIIAEVSGLSAVRYGARLRIDDPSWHGYLANVSPAEYAARFERELPGQMSGSEFLDRYAGITDSVTRVRPERKYPVRAATAHPIHEQARSARFAELLEALRVQPQAAVELGGLMYASHSGYGACGLGSDGTDRLVELVAAAGPGDGLFGAKITGGGSGGTVAILGTDAAEAGVRRIAHAYRAERGLGGAVFNDSGPGATETGVLLLEFGDRDHA